MNKIAALAIALAVVGCYRTSASTHSPNVGRAPTVALPETPPSTAYREPKRGDVYDTQKGFEDQLPPPDARGGGPATDSDIGKPRWRNNPGSYDDRTTTGRARTSAPTPPSGGR